MITPRTYAPKLRLLPEECTAMNSVLKVADCILRFLFPGLAEVR